MCHQISFQLLGAEVSCVGVFTPQKGHLSSHDPVAVLRSRTALTSTPRPGSPSSLFQPSSGPMRSCFPGRTHQSSRTAEQPTQREGSYSSCWTSRARLGLQQRQRRENHLPLRRLFSGQLRAAPCPSFIPKLCKTRALPGLLTGKGCRDHGVHLREQEDLTGFNRD